MRRHHPMINAATTHNRCYNHFDVFQTILRYPIARPIVSDNRNTAAVPHMLTGSIMKPTPLESSEPTQNGAPNPPSLAIAFEAAWPVDRISVGNISAVPTRAVQLPLVMDILVKNAQHINHVRSLPSSPFAPLSSTMAQIDIPPARHWRLEMKYGP